MKKTVLVGGCFDILHFGHVHFLKEAKKLGNYLIVALESDANIKKLKGSTRPIHNQHQRKEILESLQFVDQVLILGEDMKDEDYRNLVKNLKPSFIAVTQGDPILDKKKDHAKEVDAKVIEIKKIKVASSSEIVKILLESC
ncbi:MAG TPA: adenylyltransferase/cytidyltransferase family protein [Alphaproteobacteria bacterium]|jgi:rfaE bifunctional protein nucleotidyltransferase chain/domain|nr:adenylyltransferase/cytidyltransferase family protein [Alphaproteobacteria bacterium]